MKNNIIETITGALVILAATIFVIFAYNKAGLKAHVKGMSLNAKFDHADGISVGSDVRVAGIKVGAVTNCDLNKDDFEAEIKINIEANIKLPSDSSAQIVSDGLLGGKYISITPGADETILVENEQIKYTQSSVNIENLIGKMVFNSDKK